MRSTADPATAANVVRNARAELDRHGRWTPARDALWAVLEPHAAGRVAVVGAGNADTVPLRRLAERSAEVTLIDVDDRAATGARRRLPRALRRRVRVARCEVTGGAADAIVAGVVRPQLPTGPLPGAPYDLVVGDLLYSQLLFPGLLDAGLPADQIQLKVAAHAAVLTRALVLRLHASAPAGTVVHVHDPIAWWDGHPQPVTLADVLQARDPLAVIARGRGPMESDPRRALADLGLPVGAT